MKKFGLVLAVFLVSSVLCRADEVVLKNGDKLTGKVVDLAGGKLKFKTDHSGELQIDWGQVVKVTSDEAVKVKLSTGEMIEGKLSSGENGVLKIQSDSTNAPVEVDPAKVAKINEAPAEWHGEIDLGYFQSTGNTRKISAIANISLLRETDRDRFQIKADYRYGRTSGVDTERRAYGLIKYDYKFTSRFFGYISEELFHDRFKDLRIGTFTSVGVGYTLVKEEHTDLSAEGGVAYATNDHYDARDEGHLAGRLFVHFRQDLFFGLVFVNDFTWYPNFKHGRDWQARDEASISAGLGKGWTMRTGVIWEYDHQPAPGLYRHDELWFLTLGYHF